METNGVKATLNPLNCWYREQGLKRNSSDLNRFYSRSCPAGGADMCRKHQAARWAAADIISLRAWNKVGLSSMPRGLQRVENGRDLWAPVMPGLAQRWLDGLYSSLPEPKAPALSAVTGSFEGRRKKKIERLHLRMCGSKMTEDWLSSVRRGASVSPERSRSLCVFLDFP